MKISFLILVAFICSISVLAQQNKGAQIGQPRKVNSDSLPPARNLQLIARSYGDSVVLRWAPAKATLWYFANKAGYSIIRYEVRDKKIVLSTLVKLTVMPIKPWTLDEWKQKAGQNDSLAAAAAQLLYGKSKAESPVKKKDEGTNLQEALNKKYELENEHGLALFLADQSSFLATGLGLRYADKSIVKGKSYAYVVYALTDPAVIKSDTSGVLINTAEVMPPPEMPTISYEESDRKVKFTWSRQIASSDFSGYYYERSDDGGKTFKRLNQRPFIQLTHEQKNTPNSTIELTDSLPVNYKKYYYRIIGVTPFGDLGKPSPNLPVMGRDKTPPSPPENVAATNTGKGHVHITWTKKIKEPDFAGLLIGRGEKASGPFIPLTLSPLVTSVTEFTDTSAMAHGTNYYVVSAIDTAGNASNSIPAYVIMLDSIPPAQPAGLEGKIDTSGIVHLKWELGNEPDLMGYLVYKANDLSHPFTVVSNDFVVTNAFTDSITVLTLTKKVYYKIVAFDRNRNPSKYSDALELIRPDMIAPVSPVFTDFLVTDTSVFLKWVNSSSEDVISQILYRRERGKEWEPYIKLGLNVNSFNDTMVNKQTWYEYALEAVDATGLHSKKSFPMNVRIYDSGRRKEITNFNLTKSQDGKSLKLNWKYSGNGDYWFVIYRSVDGNNMMTYKNIKSDQQSFTDTNLKKGIYQYALKAVYKDGGESQLLKSAATDFNPSGK
jgi:fibronectin type 3 domain-containing protein